MSDAIRVRVLGRQRLRRTRYEVELPDGPRTTRIPATLLEPHIGAAEAWALVHAADEASDGGVGEWVSFPPRVEPPPRTVEQPRRYGRVNRTKVRAGARWFLPPVALSNMVATIMLADQEGWSGSTVAFAFNALWLAVMTGALWADKLWKA